VTTALPKGLEEQVILQALTGLKARAVNEGKGDELVWIDQRQTQSQEWRDRTIKRLTLDGRGEVTVETLLEQAVKSGIVKGYVLYSADISEGLAYKPREGIDNSLNTATMAAARLSGIPVTIKSESQMRALGLSCLFDAKGQEPLTYFKSHQKDFQGGGSVGLLDPKTANNRDLMIAHTLPVTYGDHPGVEAILEGVVPPASVIGWGMGNEFKHCLMVSRFGHFHTVSNWILNATFYSAGSLDYQPKRIAALDESKIDWSDKRRCMAFMMSDGDNTAYAQAGITTPRYWGNAAHGEFPMGFSVCAGDLASFSPVTLDWMSETKPPATSLIQFTGGYFYPDRFAESRSNRWELLRQHARRINVQMERSGVRIMTAIFDKSEGAEAKQALKIFAEEMPSLLGIFVMDYAPYNRSKGRLDWIDDGRGGKVPALAARYCLWQKMKSPLAGEPQTLPAIINADEESLIGGWAAVHAWSSYETPDGKKLHGMDAVKATVDGLDANKVHIVSPEELLLRMRNEKPERLK
jgi:hypothetical protein